MGKINNGLFSPFSGKIGNLVGSSRNGVYYVKTVPVRTKPFTVRELENQYKFKITEAWLKPLLSFIKVGFNNETTKRGKNAAKSYLLKNAMEGSGMEVSINPGLMKMSEGRLSLSENIRASFDANGNLLFEWDVTEVSNGNVRDQIMVLAYNTEKQEAYFLTAGNFRFTGNETLLIPKKAQAKPLHIYAAFSGFDRLSQSDSVYLGIKISP